MAVSTRHEIMSTNIPTLACHLQHWSLNKNQCQIPDDDISARSYHEKDVKKQDSGTQNIRHGQYYSVKQNFVESRGGTWILPNKRPDHLRESVKELEEILKSQFVLCIRWVKRNRIQIILHTGLLMNILISDMYDIQKLAFDKSLLTKMPSDSGAISSAILTDRFCLLSFTDRNRLAFASFTPRPGTPDHKQISTKISSMDMRISFHEIPGTSRKCERKLCVNKVEDMAICWCSFNKGPTTWTPSTTDQERANLILLGCSFGRMEVCSYVQTESDPVFVKFSRINPYQVHTLEKSINTRNESILHFTVYGCTQSKIQRLSVDTIPLRSGVLSSTINRDEDKIVIGCTDGSLIMYNILTKAVITVRTSLVPSVVSWHPNSGIVMVASGTAELRCYDSVLSPLSCALMQDVMSEKKLDTLKLSQFLASGNGLVSLTWPDLDQSGQLQEHMTTKQKRHHCYEAALLLFDGGPLTILGLNLGAKNRGLLRPFEIVKEYLNFQKTKQAIQVMQSISWNTDGQQAYLALVSVVNHLLKLPLSFDREEELEAALSAFYAPSSPLSEAVVVQYRHMVSRYARRFYHHLLRFKRFEKAFLLAKDIQDHDLFVDLYFAARDYGEVPIAKAAKQKAMELQSSSSSEEEDSYSDADSYDGESEGGWHSEDVRRTSHYSQKGEAKIKRVIPPSYPPPKMDDFMSALVNEVRAVVEEGSPDQVDDTSEVGQSSSTLKVMHLGYV